MKRIRSIGFAACAAGLLAVAGTTAARANDKITVGVIPIADVAPIYLGRAKGFFKDHGIDLSLKLAQGGASIIPSVVSGQYQFGFSNMTSLIIAESRGLHFKVVAAGDSSTGTLGHDFGAIVVPQGSPIKNAADLDGKSVAVNDLNNIGGMAVRAAVRADGGKPDSVKFVELSFPDIPAALARKRIDAAFVVEPFLTITRSQGAQAVSWLFVKTAPHLMIASYFTSDNYFKEHPDLVQRFKAAMDESLKYAQEHPDEVRAELPKYTKISPKLAEKITLPDFPVKENRASTETLNELAVKDGLIPKKIDLAVLMPSGS